MKKSVLIMVVLMLSSTAAFGFDFYFDDVFADGSSPFDFNNNTAPSYINYPTGAGLPSPGTYAEGGEPFDLEGLQVAEKDGYIYVALANSFGWAAHSTSWENASGYQDFWMGDLFIGVDGADYSLAIDLEEIAAGGSYSTALADVSGGQWTNVPATPGGYGNYSQYSDIVSAVGPFEIAQPISDKATAIKRDPDALVEVYLGMQQGYETDFGALDGDGGDTWVWEMRFSKAMLGDFSTLDFHATLACGNDVAERSYTTAVPEPTTMLLFGLGLLGAGILRRKTL